MTTSSMMKKILVALLVLLVAGSLFAAREKRKTDEKEMKGPAKMDAESAKAKVQIDSKAMAQRDKAIEQLLELLKDFPEGPKKAEVYRRLAELYWEKARGIKAIIMEEYNKKTDKYYELNDPNAPMPELNLKEAWKWNEKAVDTCDFIIKKYPNFEGIDEVYFFMASNLMEVGKPLPAIRYYTLVTEKYRNSKYAADAFYEMAEYFFNNNNVFKAMPAYKAIIDSYPNNPFFGFALYKYAWCLYNVGEYEESIKVFQQVVEYSNKSNKVELKEEALKDMVTPYAEAGSVDDAEKYFKSVVKEKKYFVMVLIKLAGIYFEQDKNEEAIKIYRKLISEVPNAPECPMWQKQIVEAYKKLNMKDNVRLEILILVEKYGNKDSAWSKANIKDEATVESATQTAEANLRILLVEYHNEARKTKAEKTWRIVEELYPKYLKYYPKSEAAYDIRFNYAEFLWENKRYEMAGNEYQVVADLNPKGHHFEDASYGAVSAFGMLLKEAQEKRNAEIKRNMADKKKAGDTGIEESRVIIAGQGKMTAKKELPPEYRPKEIPPLEMKFIKACETYIKNIPRSKYLVDIIYKQAITYYSFNHYQESVPVFEMIVQKYPRDELAVFSADLIMDSLNITEDWEAISNKAREMLRNSALISGRNRLKDDLEKFKEMATFYAAELPAQNGKTIDSAERYIAFVTEFPSSKFNDVALNNAIYYYAKGEDLYKSIRVQERFLGESAKLYKESKLRNAIMFGLAKNYEAIAYYDKAAQLYIDFVAKAGQDKNVGDAIFNAAVLYEALGDTEKALDNYKLYIDKHLKDDKEKAKIALQFGYIWMRKGKTYYDKARKGFDRFLVDHVSMKGLKDFRYIDKNGKLTGKADTTAVDVAKGSLNTIFALYAAQVKMAEEEGRTEDYYKYHDAILQLYKNGQFKDKEDFAEGTRDTIADALLVETDAKFRDFMAIDLNVKYDKTIKYKPEEINYGDESKIPKNIKKEMDTFNKETADRLTKKAEMLVELEQRYMEIIEQTKSPRLTPACLYHIGAMYRDMTESMFGAPLPPWLNENQKIVYKNMLDEKALNARQKAVEALEKAMLKGYETSVYNDWVKKAKYDLRYFQELRPDKYYDENELVPRPNMIETSSLIGRVDMDMKFPAITDEEKKDILRKMSGATAAPAAPAEQQPVTGPTN